MDRRPQPSAGRFRSRVDLQFNDRPINEFSDYVDPGMKREALREARRRLNDPIMTAGAFNDALNAILTHADKLKPWTNMVETAYERLPKRERPSARFFIMSFRAGRHDYDGVLRLMPQRFAGIFALVILAYVMEASLALDKQEILRKLAKRLPHAIEDANHPIMRRHLRFCLSEYYARYGA